MTTFCSGACWVNAVGAARASVNSTTRLILGIMSSPYLCIDLVDLFRRVFKDHFLFGRAQPFKAFDDMTGLVQPLSGFGIYYGAHTGPFRTEHAAVCPDSLEQQCERVR